ncbi:MAG: transcriptional regulator [Chitinophagaceae bacterium]|nr:transcriptional regulator [Chitinophagaceae bacterium]
MKLEQAKDQFIQLWGALGSSWGINRTMAQIHAVLLISDEARSMEDLMDQLAISRGNVNMNVRELMNWNLIYKELKPGDRREYYRAEKDIWEVAKRIARERKRREIQPLQSALNQLLQLDEDKRNTKIKSFTETVSQISRVVDKLDHAVDTMIRADEHQVLGVLMKLLK